MTPQVISLSAAGSTAWIPVDYKQNPFNIDIAVVLSNTPNLTYKVEYTLDDIFNPAITPTAFSHSSLVSVVTNSTGTIKSPVKAIRLTITSWTSGTATLTALQGIVNPTLFNINGDLATELEIHKEEHTAMGINLDPYWISRPARLWPVANLPMSAYCADLVNAYGIQSSGPVFTALKLADASVAHTYNFGAGTMVQDAWVFGDVMLSVVGGVDLGGGVRLWKLYRSIDKGVSWSAVLTPSVNDVYFLHQGICEATIAGHSCLLAAEYNVNTTRTPGGANDGVNLYRSDDRGITWNTVFTWNVGANQIRHFHGVAQDPVTGLIFLLCGDDAESRIVSWDGVTNSPATPSIANLNATPGWKAIGGSMRERFVGIAFKGEYFFGMVDSFAAQSGIWRGKCADLSDFGRVSTGPKYDTDSADNNGWYGFIATNGDIYFCTQVTAVSTARQSVIYGSRDGENWYAVAKYRCLANATACIPRSFHQIPDGRIMMQVDYATARLTKQTILLELSDMDFIEDRPDVVSPVYFVDPVSGNDSTGTGDFQTPWKTVNKAITGSRITYGARVMVTKSGVFDEVAANLAWTAHSDNPGESGQIVTISGTSREDCVLNYITPTAGGPIYRPDATQQLELEHLTARIAATGTVAAWTYTTTTTGEFRIKDAILEALENGSLVSPGIYVRGGVLTSIRSKIVAPAEKAGFSLVACQAGALPGGSAGTFSYSILDGGVGSVKATNAWTFTFNHVTALNYGAETPMTLSASSTQKWTCISSAMLSAKNEPGRDLAGLTWTGTETTYSASEIYPTAYPNPWTSGTNNLRIALNSDDEGKPQSLTSALMRLGSPITIDMWDYNRQPIVNPIVGALIYT